MVYLQLLISSKLKQSPRDGMCCCLKAGSKDDGHLGCNGIIAQLAAVFVVDQAAQAGPHACVALRLLPLLPDVCHLQIFCLSTTSTVLSTALPSRNFRRQSSSLHVYFLLAHVLIDYMQSLRHV